MSAQQPGRQFAEVSIDAMRDDRLSARQDLVAVEEPLEIRVARAGETGNGRAISITMRTPGHDAELAVGFLFGEGLIARREDVGAVRFCGPTGNVLRVELRPEVALDLGRLERNFYTSSSCGVCGKASIEAVTSGAPLRHIAIAQRVEGALLGRLPERLRAAQAVFARTGGLHAVGLFDLAGRADRRLRRRRPPQRDGQADRVALSRVPASGGRCDRAPLRSGELRARAEGDDGGRADPRCDRRTVEPRDRARPGLGHHARGRF